eukprot:GDKK01011329.1.p1 GENE.GDKK01011329.1~~GDKK01011329.1.p1  ORF type:complete len:109 (-),score=14.76 GDKK01011329.1:190-516(-)
MISLPLFLLSSLMAKTLAKTGCSFASREDAKGQFLTVKDSYLITCMADGDKRKKAASKRVREEGQKPQKVRAEERKKATEEAKNQCHWNSSPRCGRVTEDSIYSLKIS